MKTKYSLKEISQIIDAKLIGNPDEIISNISPIETAKKGDITFLANPKYKNFLKNCQATAIISKYEIQGYEFNWLIHPYPYLALQKLLNLFYPLKSKGESIHEKAFIAENVKLGKGTYIGPFACVENNAIIGENVVISAGCYVGENVQIGDNSYLKPNVVILKDCQIGKNVYIDSNTVIGSDGFGYVKDKNRYLKIPQIGKVIIEDNVEIGANVTIDRATLGITIIKKGTKIDNMVHIGHNVVVGENTILVAQVGISGSTKIGNNVTIAGQAGLAGHIHIKDNSIITAKAGVVRDVPEGKIVSGFPAIEHKIWLRSSILFEKLPELYNKLRQLEKEVNKLKKGNNK